jgi:hypothetical protein
MTRKQLEQQRECVESQLRWAVLHGGDQELLDLLRLESDRLFAMIENCPSQATARGLIYSAAQRPGEHSDDLGPLRGRELAGVHAVLLWLPDDPNPKAR